IAPRHDRAPIDRSSAAHGHAVQPRHRLLETLPRLLVVVSLVVWLGLPYASSLLTAFAEPTNQYPYPTVTPTPYGSSYSPTSTPTPFGTGAYPNGSSVSPNGTGAYPNGTGAYPNNGSSIQSGAGGSIQSGDPTQPGAYPNGAQPGAYPNGAYPGGPAAGGLPVSSVVSSAASPEAGQASDPCYGDEL